MNTLPISSRVRAAAILLPALMMVMTVSLGARARKGHVSTPAGKGKAPQSYQGGPKIWLQDRQTLQVAHVGADGTAQNKSAAQSLAAGQGQPLAMIHGDFDQDGIEDLAVGYATPGGGAIVVHRGNLDAFAPQSDASFQAIGRGEFPAPFLPQAKVFSIPIRPDFLAAGNFTGKGNTDLVAASKGGNALYVFPGDGKGNFGQPQIFSLSGAVHALAAGNLGNGQSFTNIVVGIANSQKSFSLLVLGGTGVGFGALASYPLSGPASNIVFGDLDGDARPDMAILAGGQVLIYHGASGQLGPVSLPFSVQALALGSFVFDRDSREQMALLSSDGTVHIAAHSSFDPRAFTLNEWQTMRQATVNGLPNPVVPPPVAGESWTIVESFSSVAPFSAGQPPVLFRTRISGNSADDVMVLNGFSGQMAVISHPNLKNGAATFAPGEVSTRNYSGSPVAALPMRINVDGRPGVVVLHQGQTAPAVMGPLPDPTYVVDDFTDEIVAGACGSPGPVVPGKCSLREAINEANATAGVDTITLPAGTFTLTITNATANGENNNATGDLDIKDGLNIIGAVDVGGNPATIIQAGPSAGTGIDKVFSVNPLFTTAFDTSFANLEIRFGKNLASFGTNGFGGGFDWEASHTGTMTVTNCNIHDNTIADGSGGGITATNTGGGTGQFTISSSTVSSNVAARPSGNTARGGGIFFGSATRFTITNTHIDNNQAITSNGEGGGIFVFNPGTTPISVIHGGSFTGNQSVVRGGGIRSTAGITIDQGTVISNNTSATGAGLWSNLQTSVPFPSGETTTLTKVTITGNTATTSGGGIQSDNSTPGNNLVISLSRLAGNTSPSGSNLFTPNPGGAVTATNNWWGTNAASSTIGGGATVICPTPGAGQICFDPFIVLTHTANPAKILINQSSTLTGDMSNDNHGNAVGLSNLTEIIGLPITFDNPVLGTIPEAQPETLDANAQATATFNAGGTGGRGSAHATVDQAVVSANSNLIASATESGTTVTITTVGTHNFASGETVVISGVGVGGYNGTFTIATVTPPTQFTYTDGNSGLGASSGGTANVGIIILQPPSMTKSFSPKTVSTNTDSTLTFSIDNSVNVVPINASFTDTLPGAVRVGPTPGVTNTCGGTFTPAAGDTSISFTNASLAVGTCTITVKVQSPSDGVFNNSVTLDSSDAGNATSAATDTLTVINPPTILKAFGAATIPLSGTTSLTFTLSSTNANLTLTGVAFTDTLPTAAPGTLIVANPNNLTTNCAGAATAVVGSSSISLTGSSLAPGASCTLSVNVQGTVAGVAPNSVQASSTNGGAGNTSNASVTVVGPPTISKAFNPTSIALNATSTLSFTITNPNTASALSGVAFTDNLPAGVVVAATPNVTGSCGSGTITAAAGSGAITLSGGTLTASPAAGSSCTFSADVTGTTAGDKSNTTGAVTSTEGGTGAVSNTAILTVVAPPSIAKAFNPSTIALNATTSLQFTITNPAANTVAEAGVAFTDTLPVGLTIADSSPTVCGGTLTTTAATRTIALSGASINTNSQCVFSVTVTGAASGVYTNTTGAVSSTNGGTGNTASANLTVASPPTITKAFNPTQIALNANSTLTFNINNPNTNVALSGVAFTDSLPAGLVVAATPNVTGSCGSGTITAVAGSGSISLSGGTLTASPAAGSSCTFSVDVTGTTAGVKDNSVQVTSTEGGTGNTSNASLTVVAPPTISKAFNPTSIALNATSTLSFTITNPNTASALSGVGFTDNLPAGVVVAATPNVTGSCGSGTITATAGSSTISLSGGTLTASPAAGSSCTFSVDVTGTTAGSKSNTTGAVSSTEGGTGATSNTAVLTVEAPPSIAKVFNPTTIALNATTSLTFTITNPAANTAALTGVVFTDTLPTGLTVATASATVCGGTLTTTAPTGIALSGATINTNSQCQFSVTVTGAASGVYTNTTGAVTSTNGGTGNTTSANLTVASPPTISKSFSAVAVGQNGTIFVNFGIFNPGANTIPLTGLAFTDNLPSGLVVASPNSVGNTCGGSVTAVPGSSSISLSGGTVAVNGSCSVSVKLQVTTPGTKINITGPISSTESGPGAPSNMASIDVIMPPTVAKAFGAASIPLNGTTTLTFTITDPNSTVIINNIAFGDTLPGGLVVAGGVTGTCLSGGAGVLATGVVTANGNSISLVGLELAAMGSCSFSVNVTGTTGGTKNNTSGIVTATFDDGSGDVGITGGTASASIVVVVPPVIGKAFNPTAIAPNGVSTLTFTITNPAVNTIAETGVVFTDTLPANVVVATPNGATGNCGGGTLMAVAGSNSISLTGGTIAVAVGFCAVSVNVTSAVSGTYNNTTGAVSSTNGGTGNTASAALVVMNANLSITKTHSGNFQRGQTGATYTITVSNAAGTGPTVGTVTVTDTLPAVQNTLVATAISGTGWTCNLGTLTCTRSDVLAPGASYPPITLTVSVPINIPANVTNSATVSGGGDPNSHTANDPTHIGPPIVITFPVGTAVVPPGGSTTLSATVASSPGLGALNFACAGLPFGVTCTFGMLNPSSQDPLTGTVNMTMATTAGSASALPWGPGKTAPVYAVLLFPLPLLGLVRIFAGGRKSTKAKLRMGIFFVGLLAVLAFAGCRGATGTQGTPRGSFPVSVTATSSVDPSVQATTTVILTVQ